MYPAMVQFAVRLRRTVGDGDRPGGSRLRRTPGNKASAGRAHPPGATKNISAPRVYRNFIT